MNWLLKNGFEHSTEAYPKTFQTIISSMGQWYAIDICYGFEGKKKIHTAIYDSLKKIPFPVKQIARDFKLPILKGDIDYHKDRPIGYQLDENEISYLRNDVEIIARALEIQFGQGLEKMTIGSDALNGYKEIVSKKNFERIFPVFSLEMNEDLRACYKGGFTWCNPRFQGQVVGRGLVFDVNSLYPAQMYDRLLPYGQPIFFKGAYKEEPDYPLYIQHVRCGFYLKDNHIPCIQLKGRAAKQLGVNGNDYLDSSKGELVDLYLTNVDLDLIREHYELYEETYVDGWMFRGKVGMFKDYIDKWMYVKTHEKGAKKLLAKLMLNNLYGKFATNPDVTGKVPSLKEDGSTAFKLGEEEFKDPVYTPMGAFITAWGRYTTITTAQKCFDRILYCDTDSIHLLGDTIPEAIAYLIDEDRLGYWAHESTFVKAKFLRQKTYIEWHETKPLRYIGLLQNGTKVPAKLKRYNGKVDVKCAGMPERIKEVVTFRNFEIGFRVETGRLKPAHVSGGVVLVDQPFEIRKSLGFLGR